MEICYHRETGDKQCAAWYVESWYYGHHYRVFSYSPWHTSYNGSRFEKEEDARAAVDRFLDEQVPMMLQCQRQGR